MNSNDKLIDVIMKQLDRLEEKQEEVYRKLTAIEERTKATQEDIEELEEMKDEFYKYKNIIIAVGCGLSSLVSFLVSVFDFKNFFK